MDKCGTRRWSGSIRVQASTCQLWTHWGLIQDHLLALQFISSLRINEILTIPSSFEELKESIMFNCKQNILLGLWL